MWHNQNMRIHRFYTPDQINDGKIVIQDERLIHQWRNVFRYNVGSEVVLFDGSGHEYRAQFVELSNRSAVLEVVSKRKSIMPKNNINLFQSIIKKDKMEWIVEKATELGVTKIIPIVSERSEKKNLNQERMFKIAMEASEQCGRGDVPQIEDGQKLSDVSFDQESEIIVFDPSGTTSPPPSSPALPARQVAKERGESPISIFIGPEGGWSEKELDFFKQKNAQIYSLGDLILRAETAAIVALSKFI